MLAMSAVANVALALAIPLHFEPNRGQAEPNVRYVAVAPEYTLALSDTSIDMQFACGGSLRMKLPRTPPAPAELLPGKTNYYNGSDSSAWRTGVPNYARVQYKSVFPGVDLAIYGNRREIEYDWLVAPGADPAAIRLSFTGATRMRVDAGGDLVLETAGGEIRHQRPRIYQIVDRQRREIPGGFVLARGGQVRFHLGAYDKRRPLVIDPKLVYSTGFGGSGITYDNVMRVTVNDTPTSIALDRAGNAYITGTTYSSDFPLVHSSEQAPAMYTQGIFVAKLSPSGTTLLYSTYVTISSGPGPLLPASIAVDAEGNAFITGATFGADLSIVPGRTQATAGGADAFLLALNPDGVVWTARLFGGIGDDAGTSITLGPDGNLYLAGVTQSPDFPTTPHAYRAGPVSTGDIFLSWDIFLMKINPRALIAAFPGSQPIVYSTYLGPTLPFDSLEAFAFTPVAVSADAAGNAYVAAPTSYTGWSVTSGAVQAKCAGDCQSNVIALKINPNGSNLLYATYFGGSGGEAVGGLAIDASGNAYISGTTASADLPVTMAAFQTAWSPAQDGQYGHYQTAFVVKLSPDATRLVYSTYLGGTVEEAGAGIAVDAAGNAYVSGWTISPDFPILNALQVSLANAPCLQGPSGQPESLYCPSAGFLSVLNPAGTSLVWSTFLGGPTSSPDILPSPALVSSSPAYARALDSAGALALDGAGDVYVTGLAIDPTGARQTGSATNSVGVIKIAPQGNPLQFASNGITNAASFNPGLPAPGGLASLFVHGLNVSGTVIASGNPLPTELEGLSILVDGIPAPILAVVNLPAENPQGTQQINFQVPFEAMTNGVELRYQGLSTFVLPEAVAPGIFTLPDGTGAIQHASDYSLVTASHPAAPGEAIIIYATGLGPVAGNVADGVPAPGPAAIQPPCGSGLIFAVLGGTYNTEYEGTPANILYMGLTPGYVGLYQVNVQVPPSTPAGDTSLYIIWPGCWFFFGAPGNIPPNSYFSNTVTLPVR